LHILRKLKAMGISVAMDDFGIGYSSLATLHAFPFDKIKLDQSFVKRLPEDAAAAAIVRTVLALGASLGMPVLAEGIETDAQWQFLDRAGGGVGGAPLDFLHRSLSREICPNIVGRVTLLPFEASISQQGRMGMADNKKKRGGADRGLIALSEPYEVAYWSKKFKITPAKLKAAVKKVGRSAKKVEAYIKLQAHKAADRARIAMSQPYEVSYWSKKFKVTPAKLKAAVAAVGHSSKAVGAYLARDKGTKTGAKKAKKAAAKTPRKTAKKRAKKAA
jgi:hypothetical protein